MKRILLILTAIILCGCSSSLEDFAKERSEFFLLDKIQKKMLKDNEFAEKLEIYESDIVYNTDTMCIINYIIKSKTYGRSENQQKWQYIIYKDFFLSNKEGCDVFFEQARRDVDVVEKYKENQEKAKKLKKKGFPKKLDGLYNDLFNNTLFEYILSYKSISSYFTRVPKEAEQ